MRPLGKPAPVARFPEGRVGYAVGDVHGRADLLDRMLARIADDASAAAPGTCFDIVFLGDYVDRGPDSRGVVERLATLRSLAAAPVFPHFLRGNHDETMRGFLEDPLERRAWLSFGGLDTLASYGVRPLPSVGSGPAALRRAAAHLAELMPSAHRDFLDNLELTLAIGDYLFVHAGLRPGRALERQAETDCLWIRNDFLKSTRRFDHVIVHGHSPAAAPFRDARRIGVDTGAYETGVLTAARLEGEEVSFFSVQT